MKHLTQRATLVRLTVSVWSARKSDGLVETAVEERYRASPGVGTYLKYLLPGNRLLARVRNLANSMRHSFSDPSLPWYDDGTRIMPNEEIPAFMHKLRKVRPAWNAAVKELLEAYEQSKSDARKKLGELYQDEDYPSAKELATKFGIDLSISPVPTSDFRVDELPAEDVDLFKNVFELKQKRALLQATCQLWNMVRSVLHRLKKPRHRLSQAKLTARLEQLKFLNFGMDAEFSNVLVRLDRKDLEGMDEDIDSALGDLRKKIEELDSQITAIIAKLMTERILQGSAS